MRSIPTIAIVGRTNVGKSTLFNLLAGQDLALVEDKHGVTRDRNYITLYNYANPFTLVDTGGLVGEEEIKLAQAVREQTEIAIHEADIIIAVFDGKDGLHPLDRDVVQRLRQSEKPVLWVANKCEKEDFKVRATEIYGLGIEELHFISAAHNIGIRELLKAIWKEMGVAENEAVEPLSPEKRPLRIAIIGKPNCGKSTFVNKLMGGQRVITSSVSGTTRDSINLNLTRDGQEYVLIDTAGLRKEKNIAKDTLEQIASFRTLRSLSLCDVALLFLDATLGIPTEQDAKLAELVHERGKGLIIIINKWDAIEKDHKSAKEYENGVKEVFRFCPYAPVLFVSAMTGQRCPSVLKKAEEIFKAGQHRIKTSDFNNVMKFAVDKKSMPVYRGEPLKFFFGTQTGVLPPTFVLFFNQPAKVPDSYLRYLKNTIREYFPFSGYDLKVITKKRRSRDNPE